MAVLRAVSKDELLSLDQLGKYTNPRRGYHTLRNWIEQGLQNRSGDPIRLEYRLVAGVKHSTVENVERFLDAVNSKTIDATCYGGCLNGARVKINDAVERLLSGQLADQLNGVCQADALYLRKTFIDRSQQIRTFLVWAGVAEPEEEILKMLEGE